MFAVTKPCLEASQKMLDHLLEIQTRLYFYLGLCIRYIDVYIDRLLGPLFIIMWGNNLHTLIYRNLYGSRCKKMIKFTMKLNGFQENFLQFEYYDKLQNRQTVVII